MGLKRYRAEIWGRTLFCPVCGNAKWFAKKVRIEDFERPLPNEMRHMLECCHCGYDMMFGLVTDWDTDENNLTLTEEW